MDLPALSQQCASGYQGLALLYGAYYFRYAGRTRVHGYSPLTYDHPYGGGGGFNMKPREDLHLDYRGGGVVVPLAFTKYIQGCNLYLHIT